MKKLLVLILSTAAAFCAVFALTACEAKVDKDGNVTITDGDDNGGSSSGSGSGGSQGGNESGDSGSSGGGETPPAHTHAYTKQVATDEYLKQAATCTQQAVYYYSCECGETGSETFTYGNALGHKFTNYIFDDNATCTQDGTKTATCDHSGCNEKCTIKDIGSVKGHTYSEEWSQSETEHWHAATCGHTVEKDRAAHKFDENKKCTVCNYATAEPFGLELQSSVFDIDPVTKTAYLKVANAVTDYDFSDKFKVTGGAKFDVCTDKQCNNRIASKKTDIAIGDNVFYILVTNDNDVASYTITIRRRPIYTVMFDTNGGSIVESQQVEEDNYATEPTTTEEGYNFVKWDYDFSTPIVNNETITASWQIIIYNIAYALNGGENAKNNPETYTVEDEIVLSASSKLGYTFTGWSNDGKIVKGSTGDITFTASYSANVKLSPDGTTITGLNNKVSSLIILSEYNGTKVTAIGDNAFQNCSLLTSTTIPDGVTSIGNSAFSGCWSLTSVVIPDSVTSIGSSAFEGCSSLKSITIPDGVTSIGNSAFEGCSSLKSITIPDGVTSIGKSAFV